MHFTPSQAIFRDLAIEDMVKEKNYLTVIVVSGNYILILCFNQLTAQQQPKHDRRYRWTTYSIPVHCQFVEILLKMPNLFLSILTHS